MWILSGAGGVGRPAGVALLPHTAYPYCPPGRPTSERAALAAAEELGYPVW